MLIIVTLMLLIIVMLILSIVIIIPRWRIWRARWSPCRSSWSPRAPRKNNLIVMILLMIIIVTVAYSNANNANSLDDSSNTSSHTSMRKAKQTHIAQLVRIGSERQEVRGSNARLGGIPSLWRDEHPAIEGLRPPGHRAGQSIRTNKTPPSQKQTSKHHWRIQWSPFGDRLLALQRCGESQLDQKTTTFGTG